MSDFNNDAEKVLAKAQSLRDRCSHSYLGAAHLAVGLVEGPDATLKKLYKSKGAKTNELRGKLEPFVQKIPRMEGVNPDVEPDNDLNRILRASVQAARQVNRMVTPGDMLVALMKFSGDRGLAKVFEDALGSVEALPNIVAQNIGFYTTDPLNTDMHMSSGPISEPIPVQTAVEVIQQAQSHRPSKNPPKPTPY